MARQQAGKVRLQSRVDVDEQEILSGQEVRRVSKRAGGPEDFRLVEKPGFRRAGRESPNALVHRLR